MRLNTSIHPTTSPPLRVSRSSTGRPHRSGRPARAQALVHDCQCTLARKVGRQSTWPSARRSGRPVAKAYVVRRSWRLPIGATPMHWSWREEWRRRGDGGRKMEMYRLQGVEGGKIRGR